MSDEQRLKDAERAFRAHGHGVSELAAYCAGCAHVRETELADAVRDAKLEMLRLLRERAEQRDQQCRDAAWVFEWIAYREREHTQKGPGDGE